MKAAHNWLRPKVLPLAPSTAHSHHLWSLESETWDDPEKLYAEERRLLDERQVLPLILLPEYAGIAPSVRNWTTAPSGEWRLADVWLDAGESAASNPEVTTGRNVAPGVHP